MPGIKIHQGETPTISINWDAWQEVGMAVEAARQQLRTQPCLIPSGNNVSGKNPEKKSISPT